MRPDENRPLDNVLADHDETLEKAMGEILRSIKNVRFGSIEITIHDSRVVQIERKEKVRFAAIARAKTG
ncbi:MAG TPA: YezD family protein [Candidatus Binataceae bacterium]|jgi:hypothetical protein|nr:YezD family protein [Candidatus Binataceae bacterium]